MKRKNTIQLYALETEIYNDCIQKSLYYIKGDNSLQYYDNNNNNIIQETDNNNNNTIQETEHALFIADNLLWVNRLIS